MYTTVLLFNQNEINKFSATSIPHHPTSIPVSHINPTSEYIFSGERKGTEVGLKTERSVYVEIVIDSFDQIESDFIDKLI